MLIFTSGTTGTPKAVKITNRRWSVGALGTAAAGMITTNDTVYCCMPLYHSTGMLIAVGGALAGGARLALAPRFSVNTFWNDINRYGATVVSYVGEMCRYLVGAPATSHDKTHSIRLFIGNGLRADVWKTVNSRFEPDRIIEFYSSTEGNVALVNLTGTKIGSVGRPIDDGGRVELVKCDISEQKIKLDARGRPVICEPGDIGLLIAHINDAHPLNHFDGYVDDEATEKKIARNLFEQGDAWFSTGDLLRRDEDGDYWFEDRMGDAFRWKGETVSAEQVASVVSRVEFVAFAAAYGVPIPGREGKAGVVAVELAPAMIFNGKGLFEHVYENLPSAARPRIIRVVNQVETTATMKFLKYKLRQEGADPSQIGDALYLYNPEMRDYSAMRPEDYPDKID